MWIYFPLGARLQREVKKNQQTLSYNSRTKDRHTKRCVCGYYMEHRCVYMANSFESYSLANGSLFVAQLIFPFAFSWHRACSLESLIYLLCLLPAHFPTHLLLRCSLYAVSDLINVISAITDACTVFCIRCFGSPHGRARSSRNMATSPVKDPII